MTHFSIKSAILMMSVVSLIASGTTGGNNSNSTNFQTISEAHATKKTFTGEAVGINYSPAIGVNLVPEKKSASLVANSIGGFDVVLAGEKFTFSAADYDATQKRFTKKISATEIVQLKVSDFFDTQYKYASFLDGAYTNSATGYFSEYAAAFGTETEEMPNSKTVLLTGTATMIAATKPTVQFFGYEGDINITANFETNKLGGDISNFTVINGTDKIPGQFILEDGTITHNSFKANINGSSDMNTFLGASKISGKLNGGFFGPNAEETAGTFTVTAPNAIFGGAFIAKQ